jgi:hypothetical protein
VITETSLELIPSDGVDICMGATVCLPPICYGTKELGGPLQQSSLWKLHYA